MLADVDTALGLASRSKHPTEDQLKLATTALVATIMFQSTQCSGAFINVTLDGYDGAAIVEGIKVIKVANHKMDDKRLAKLTVEGKLLQHLDQYVNLLCPLMDPTVTLHALCN